MTRALVAVVLLLGAWSSQRTDIERPLVRLDPASAIEAEIGGGEVHRYDVPAAAGDFVRLLVRPFGTDLLVGLARDEQILAEVAGPEASTRIVSFVAEAPALHRLEVRSATRPERRGRYRLSVGAWRSAREGDAERVSTDRLVAQARKLRREGSKESLAQAAELNRRAIEGWRDLGETLDQADALAALGEITFSLGDSGGAVLLFEQELPLRRAAEDRQGEGEALNNLGVMHAVRGLRRRALEYYEQALPIRREVGDKQGEAQTLRNMGVNWTLLDEYQKAADALQASLPLRREAGDRRGEGFTLHSLGGLHFRLGQLETALEYAEQALAIRRELGDRTAEGQTLLSIGLVYTKRGDLEKARPYYEQALGLLRATGDRAGEAGALQGLGESYATSEPARALVHFEQALAIARTNKDRPLEASTLRFMAVPLLRLGDAAAAGQRLREGLVVSREIGDRSAEAAALHALGRIERDHGDLDQARELMESALGIVDAVRLKVAREDLRQTFVAARQQQYEDHVELLMEQHRRRPGPASVGAAFAAAEHARARTLRDLLIEAGADVRRGLDPTLAQRLRQAQEQLNDRERERRDVFAAPSSEGAREKARRAVQEALVEYRDLEAQVRAASPRLAALRQPTARTAAELQSLIDPDTLLLEYALGEKRSYVFVATSETLMAYELPPRATVEAAARAFQQRLVASRQRVARVGAQLAARELFGVLLAPAARWLPGRRLVVVPDGALHAIPFGALVRPATGRPLVADHEIVQLPALAVIAHLREDERGAAGAAPRRSGASSTVAVVADPVLDARDPRVRARPSGLSAPAAHPGSQGLAGLPPSLGDVGDAAFARLPFSRREAEAIRRLAGPRAFVALDFAASRETVMSGRLRDARIVHFATHGLLNGRQPELSGLVLSLVDEAGRPRDGFLRLHEVYDLELDADLVVLSACRTGVGPEVRGEGLVSLTRGFMYAGTPRVMASLWNVRDEASAELMRLFYDGLLRRKLRPAAALRAAQVSLAKEPRWSAPFYWAGFVLQGEWR